MPLILGTKRTYTGVLPAKKATIRFSTLNDYRILRVDGRSQRTKRQRMEAYYELDGENSVTRVHPGYARNLLDLEPRVKDRKIPADLLVQILWAERSPEIPNTPKAAIQQEFRLDDAQFDVLFQILDEKHDRTTERGAPRAYWFIQTNPDQYDLQGCARVHEYDYWRAKTEKGHHIGNVLALKPGDRAIFWQSGDPRGVLGYGTVLSGVIKVEPDTLEEFEEFGNASGYENPEDTFYRVKIAFGKILAAPIPLETLQAQPGYEEGDFSNLGKPGTQGTFFRASKEAWDLVVHLVDQFPTASPPFEERDSKSIFEAYLALLPHPLRAVKQRGITEINDAGHYVSIGKLLGPEKAELGFSLWENTFDTIFQHLEENREVFLHAIVSAPEFHWIVPLSKIFRLKSGDSSTRAQARQLFYEKTSTSRPRLRWNLTFNGVSREVAVKFSHSAREDLGFLPEVCINPYFQNAKLEYAPGERPGAMDEFWQFWREYGLDTPSGEDLPDPSDPQSYDEDETLSSLPDSLPEFTNALSSNPQFERLNSMQKAINLWFLLHPEPVDMDACVEHFGKFTNRKAGPRPAVHSTLIHAPHVFLYNERWQGIGYLRDRITPDKFEDLLQEIRHNATGEKNRILIDLLEGHPEGLTVEQIEQSLEERNQLDVVGGPGNSYKVLQMGIKIFTSVTDSSRQVWKIATINDLVRKINRWCVKNEKDLRVAPIGTSEPHPPSLEKEQVRHKVRDHFKTRRRFAKLPTMVPSTSRVGEVLQIVIPLLERKKQVILYGPPGTGKTHLACLLASHLTAENPDQWKLVQFHPEYTYENFVECLRVKSASTMEFEPTPQVFRRLCQEAREARDNAQSQAVDDWFEETWTDYQTLDQSPEGRDPDQFPLPEDIPPELVVDPPKYVLIVDEINRGDLSRIFGEVIMGLEYRDVPIKTMYFDDDHPLVIPENLYIIGTMNSTDRSIALVDFALRRRFYFYQLLPDRVILSEWLAEKRVPDAIKTKILGLFDRLNGPTGWIQVTWKQTPMLAENYQVGHALFFHETEEAMRVAWQYAIVPLLYEYMNFAKSVLDDFHRHFDAVDPFLVPPSPNTPNSSQPTSGTTPDSGENPS